MSPNTNAISFYFYFFPFPSFSKTKSSMRTIAMPAANYLGNGGPLAFFLTTKKNQSSAIVKLLPCIKARSASLSNVLGTPAKTQSGPVSNATTLSSAAPSSSATATATATATTTFAAPLPASKAPLQTPLKRFEMAQQLLAPSTPKTPESVLGSSICAATPSQVLGLNDAFLESMLETSPYSSHA